MKILKFPERPSPKLIVRKNEKDTDMLEIEMFHVIHVNRQNPEYNFAQYLNELMKEFQYELTRLTFPARPATQSHIVVPDPEDISKEI